MNITDHLYLNKSGTKYEISVGKDASGNDVVTVTRVGRGAASTRAGGEQVDWENIKKHLYLNKNGTKYEISVGKDSSGNHVVTVTPVRR